MARVVQPGRVWFREIISYSEMLQREEISLQKRMNFKGRDGYSSMLTSGRMRAEANG